MEQIKRGEIYYAELSPVVGSEQDGNRPVIILQNDKGNKHSTTARMRERIPNIRWSISMRTKD